MESRKRHQRQQQQLSPQLQRVHSIEDDDRLSNNSSLNGSNTNSDSEPGSMSVCVRDMIRRYDIAAKRQQTQAPLPPLLPSPRRTTSNHALMATCRSSYVGINKFGSQTNVRKTVTRLQEQQEQKLRTMRYTSDCNDGVARKHKVGSGCASECGRRRQHSSKTSLSEGGGSARERHDSDAEQLEPPPLPLQQRRSLTPARRPSYMSMAMEEAPLQPLEASYQSKTTIAKTASGVRIIIDICFEQDQHMSTADVVGSRVETDIPQSRILTEFQQQAHSLNDATSTEGAGQLHQVTSI